MGQALAAGSSGASGGRVGVAVITRNRRDRLLATLARLRRLPERPAVVVVDNDSDDGTVDAVMERFPEVTLLASPVDLGHAARNAAVDWIDAPYLAFCDDDAAWEPGSLALAADLFDADDDLALLCAPTTHPRPPTASHDRRPLRTGTLGAPVLRFRVGASIVRRRAFLEVGRFDGRMRSCDEELLAIDLLSAGWRTARVAGLAVTPTTDPDLHEDPPDAEDPAGIAIRNELWTTWLRRSSPGALRHTGDVLRSLPLDGRSARGVASAVQGLPWVLRSRRPVPPTVERELRRRDRESSADGDRAAAVAATPRPGAHA